MNRTNDIQGRFLGIPYDWRFPTLLKAVRRIYQPGGPLFVPKVFGWGWTINLAHPVAWLLMGVVLALVLGGLISG